jgi:DNA-binding NarL/FixJ family response regulator
MNQPIKVLLCDDHSHFRNLIKAMLRDAPFVKVVGEAADGKQGLDKALSIHPDVVVMDLNMPVLNGIEATRRIVKADEKIRVVILTMYSDEDLFYRCKFAGASGYVLKDQVAAHLVKALEAVSSGDKYFLREKVKSA